MMMTKEELKAEALWNIDQRREEVIGLGEQIFSHPELGFKETNTARLVRDTLTGLGLPHREGLALTGVRGDLDGRNPGPRVMVMGELDAVVCPLHPQADPLTGAAHSCGHNAQIASMLGAAMGLTPLAGELDGSVAFVAVPAEEYVELEYRERLREEGKIEFFGGKQEFLRLGLFDDIDMGMMVHSHAGLEDRRFLIGCYSSGFIGKIIRFTGKEAHAGRDPLTASTPSMRQRFLCWPSILRGRPSGSATASGSIPSSPKAAIWSILCPPTCDWKPMSGGQIWRRFSTPPKR